MSNRSTLARLLLALLSGVLAIACGASLSARRSGAPGSAVHFSRPPVIDGSRRACLAPPYAPPEGTTALPDGTLVEHVADGRSWTFKLPGDRDATPEESAALLQRLRAAHPDQPFLSFGLYCGSNPGHMCFRIAGNLCELRIEDALARFREVVQLDGQLASSRLQVSIALEGRLGPRCTPADAACEPTSYEGGVYDPARGRHAGPLATHSAGACAQDGECMVQGCGNHCTSWEYGGAHEGATCEGYAFDQPIFCGCVEGSCAWFTQ